METTFLSPLAKRNLQYITTTATTAAAMPEPVPNKRFKSQQQPGPQPFPAGHVSFRLLCHEFRIGGLIGKSGSIIKQIQQDTGAKIRIEDAPRDCPDRVVSIIAPNGVDSKINLGDGVDIEVSKGQGALIKVFERILEVAAESSGAGVVAAGGVVSCRMLAGASQVGSVIGKGGKVVEKIRKDCGVKIRVLTDKLPACASATEEIVEIEGDVLAVMKALIAVTHRLQDCQPVGKTKVTGSNPVEPVHQEYFPELPSSILSQRNLVLSSLPIESVSYASRHPFSLESERVSAAEMKIPQQEVVFKILCSNDRVGGIIGRGGSIVKAIQNETGATIGVGATAAECDERLITITAMENPENRYSAAQRTVVLLFSRSVEAGFEKGYKGSSVTARLIVSPSQVGCLLGKGGCIISEMRRVTGAGIKIVGADQVPKCVQQNDQLIQISGDLVQVKDAIYHVTGRLRDNLLSTLLNAPVSVLNETSAYGTSAHGGLGDALQEASRDLLRDPIRDVLRDPFRDSLRDPLRDAFGEPLRDRFREPLRDPVPLSFHSAVGVSSGLNRHATTLTQGIDHLGCTSSLDRLSPPRLWASQRINEINERSIMDASRGLSSLKTGLGHVSGSKSITVTNTTIEILVPEDVIGSVYGENGRNLARLKEISGAKVIVHEPHLGTSDRIVVISGTPDETQAAQSLLEAFILTGT